MSSGLGRRELFYHWNTLVATLTPHFLTAAFRYLRSNPFVNTVVRRLDRLHLLPIHDEAGQWKNVGSGSNWDTALYLRVEPRRLLLRVMDSTPKDESVLDLGCNSGSDLNILRNAGWSHLVGIDVGEEALKRFAEEYPETYVASRIYCGRFEDVLPMFETRSIDTIFSNGATLELVHPAWRIEAQMARVCKSRILLDINEKGHTYPRDYVKIFRKSGMVLVDDDRPLDRVHGSSLLIFERLG